MRRIAILTAFMAAVCGLLIYTISSAAPGSSETRAELGKAAPDFKLKDIYGKEFTLSEFKGKIVVLEWVNRECPVSAGAHKKGQMQGTYKKYADKNVVWLGIDSTHSAVPEKNRIYVAQAGLTFPILHDPDGKVGHSYQAKTTPHMFVIDKEGTLVYNGAIDDEGDKNYVAAVLEDVLAGRPVATPKTAPYGCSVKYARAD